MLRRLAGSSVSASVCGIGGLDEPWLIFLSKESALKASVMPGKELAGRGGCWGGVGVSSQVATAPIIPLSIGTPNSIIVGNLSRRFL